MNKYFCFRWGALAASCFAFVGSLVSQPACAQSRRSYVEWDVEPSSADWVYQVGESASATIRVSAGGAGADGIWLRYAVGDDMMPLAHDSVLLRDGKAVVSLGTRLQPGFRTLQVDFSVAGVGYSMINKAAFSPQDIKAVTRMPDDFDAFWHKKIEAARKVKLRPVLTKLADKSTADIDVYKVCLTVGANDRKMYGYLSIPRDGQKHPVLFCPPGAGVKIDAYDEKFSRNGYIFLSVEIHGLDPDAPDDFKQQFKKEFKEYQAIGLQSPDTYYYADVYAGCVRCIDYLCSLPEWDGRNVGVTGGSQGGALSIVAAALHRQVTFAAVFYPALSNIMGFAHGQAGGWPRFFSDRSTCRNPLPATQQQAEVTAGYYDVVNFAQKLTVPCFFNYGHADEVTCPTSVRSAINAVSAPKTLVVTPASGHWRFPEVMAQCFVWMSGQLR